MIQHSPFLKSNQMVKIKNINKIYGESSTMLVNLKHFRLKFKDFIDQKRHIWNTKMDDLLVLRSNEK